MAFLYEIKLMAEQDIYCINSHLPLTNTFLNYTQGYLTHNSLISYKCSNLD